MIYNSYIKLKTTKSTSQLTSEINLHIQLEINNDFQLMYNTQHNGTTL